MQSVACLSTETITTICAITLALVAFLALLAEPIRGWIKRPELTISPIMNKPPDFVKIQAEVTIHLKAARADVEKLGTRPIKVLMDAYFVQLHVSNKEGRWSGRWHRFPAEEVEVYLEGVYVRENGDYLEVESILPQNLCWAYMEFQSDRAVYYPKLPAGSRRPCSLCGINQQEGKDEAPLLSIKTTVRMVSEEAFQVQPGNYKLVVTVSAKNAKPTRKEVLLYFTGEWHDDPGEMWEKGLSAELIVH